MTVSDLPRWAAAISRLCVCYDKALSAEQRDAWYDQLERYSIEAVEQACREAPAESGRFFPTVGLLEQLAKKAMAGVVRTTGDWHAPQVERDPTTGLVVARWRCVLCEDTGWRAKVTDGQLLTNAELVAPAMADRLRQRREDGQPTYVMRRCDCRQRRTAVA